MAFPRMYDCQRTDEKAADALAFMAELRTDQRLSTATLRTSILTWRERYPALDSYDFADAIAETFGYTERHRHRLHLAAITYSRPRQESVNF